MLDLSICQRCAKFNPLIVKTIRDRGFVYCPIADFKDRGLNLRCIKVSISSPPPEWCLHKFEQAVAFGVNIDKKE